MYLGFKFTNVNKDRLKLLKFLSLVGYYLCGEVVISEYIYVYTVSL